LFEAVRQVAKQLEVFVEVENGTLGFLDIVDNAANHSHLLEVHSSTRHEIGGFFDSSEVLQIQRKEGDEVHVHLRSLPHLLHVMAIVLVVEDRTRELLQFFPKKNRGGIQSLRKKKKSEKNENEI
jgi:hypothetical protein